LCQDAVQPIHQRAILSGSGRSAMNRKPEYGKEASRAQFRHEIHAELSENLCLTWWRDVTICVESP
jgi:hypothetical protein